MVLDQNYDFTGEEGASAGAKNLAAYTFLAARGHKVGKSLVQQDQIELVAQALAKAERMGVPVLLPEDHVCGASFAASRPTSSAVPSPCSKDMANASLAHWFLSVIPTTLIPPASR